MFRLERFAEGISFHAPRRSAAQHLGSFVGIGSGRGRGSPRDRCGGEISSGLRDQRPAPFGRPLRVLRLSFERFGDDGRGRCVDGWERIPGPVNPATGAVRALRHHRRARLSPP